MIPAPILPYTVAAAALAAVLGVWIWRRRRLSPAEKERRRRIVVGRAGRVTDGSVTDAHDGELYYQYSVGGVEYSTSQDVSTLLDRLPAAPAMLIGPASVRFLPRNPANSILISEEWCGLRPR